MSPNLSTGAKIFTGGMNMTTVQKFHTCILATSPGIDIDKGRRQKQPGPGKRQHQQQTTTFAMESSKPLYLRTMIRIPTLLLVQPKIRRKHTLLLKTCTLSLPYLVLFTHHPNYRQQQHGIYFPKCDHLRLRWARLEGGELRPGLSTPKR